jgi:hypothetical protein
MPQKRKCEKNWTLPACVQVTTTCMTNIHETAYPILPAEPSAAELKASFTPTTAEMRFGGQTVPAGIDSGADYGSAQAITALVQILRYAR